MSVEHVEVEMRPAGVVLWLNRPAKANCLSLSMMRRLTEALLADERRPAVIAARGVVFSSGLDLTELNTPAAIRERLTALRDLVVALRTRRGATASLVRGPVVAGGVALACGAHWCFATSAAHFSAPADPVCAPLVAVLLTLLRAVRPAARLDGLPAGFRASEAAGLVDELVPPELGAEEVLMRLRDCGAGGTAKHGKETLLSRLPDFESRVARAADEGVCRRLASRARQPGD
jgi:enoyl-CoA hydratase/carnithine racemase